MPGFTKYEVTNQVLVISELRPPLEIPSPGLYQVVRRLFSGSVAYSRFHERLYGPISSSDVTTSRNAYWGCFVPRDTLVQPFAKFLGSTGQYVRRQIVMLLLYRLFPFVHAINGIKFLRLFKNLHTISWVYEERSKNFWGILLLCLTDNSATN